MAWVMELLNGGRPRREPATGRVVEVEGGEWEPVRPAPIAGANLPPWRYDDRRDAEAMLGRLHPDVPEWAKRVRSI